MKSTTLANEDCVILGERISGVQAHEITDLCRYDGEVWRQRLRDPLTPEESLELTAELLSHLGEPYSKPKAVLSASHWLNLPFRWEIRKAPGGFCSNLWAWAFNEALRHRRGWRRIDPECTPEEFVDACLATGLFQEPERIL